MINPSSAQQSEQNARLPENPYQSPRYDSPPDPVPDQSDAELRKRIDSYRMPIIVLTIVTVVCGAVVAWSLGRSIEGGDEIKNMGIFLALPMSALFFVPVLYCLWSRSKLKRLLADRQESAQEFARAETVKDRPRG